MERFGKNINFSWYARAEKVSGFTFFLWGGPARNLNYCSVFLIQAAEEEMYPLEMI